MGFLDNLLNKEARKILTNVVDSVVDNVKDSVRESLGTAQPHGSTVSGSAATGGSTSAAAQKQTAAVSNATAAVSGKAGHRESEVGDDEDCHCLTSVICSRIEKIAAEDWPSYELRQNIPATEVGGGEKDQGFEYGLYLDGQPRLMIMILDPHQYRNKCVQRSHKACRDKGIGSFHLLWHLPNRKTYIAERMKACMPK